MTTPNGGPAGDPCHPDDETYIIEFGRVTCAAAGLTGTAFDACGSTEARLHGDQLGRLEYRSRRSRPGVDCIDEFIDLLDSGRIVSNDLIHAMPVRHGLHPHLASRKASAT